MVQGFIDQISQPWHWAVSGAAIAGIVFLMTWMGRSFGVSTSFKGWCSLLGAGRRFKFFQMDLKDELWRFMFVIGAVIGGVIAVSFLRSPEPVDISAATVEYLGGLGIDYPAADHKMLGFFPTSLFNFSNITGLLLAVAGGFLVGFGARYGQGCTSGHAITGLSHLQVQSLLTVIGFFIGGLVMTHLLFPLFV
ncbi:MAG: YeeE/YedE thiosulfate transporter family protein [Saprospiraceae bacterium]|nr:YeeE/YedE thiosulfate transporter family protein [Saprospiraceae bacterium]